MPKPRLHLDADTSIRQLQHTLRERGHDVTHTPNDWLSPHADGKAQLLAAAAQGRVTFTFNVGDYLALAQRHTHHGGMALAAQCQWTLSALIVSLDRMLTETTAEEWLGQAKWLIHWKSSGDE